MTSLEITEQAFRLRSAKMGIVGLGHVGLSLVPSLLDAGFTAMGFDIDPKKIARLIAGDPQIRHIPADRIAAAVACGAFEPTADMRRLGEPDALILCVPTPLSASRDPDLDHVAAAARQIAATLRPGQLIAIESTTYPGATRNVVLPILESSGLQAGRDFFLAYCPERHDPGNRQFGPRNTPRVVGAADAASQRLAEVLYAAIAPSVVGVSSCEAAEACKLLENAYRAVNIALVNELKRLLDRMGIDIWEVVEAAKSKPFGFQAFYPGPGPGGHCIPIDPHYLSWVARQHGLATRLIDLAGEINGGMPDYVLERLAAALDDRRRTIRGSRILILGVAYKRDLDDTRESPALAIIARLVERGAAVNYNDPHVPRLPRAPEKGLPEMASLALTAELLAEQDCVLIAADHSEYDFEFIVRHASLVLDTRNATRGVRTGRERIVRA